ncbi:EpsG family protein [Ornithinimicrobium sp. LYQ103]|uniref:EpsG family protein n=1 Tax=Ornithinimicrobium sp. LYQ103 TaxID=3378796 RepID=UPI0038538B27
MLPYLVLAAVVPAVMGIGEAVRRQFATERRRDPLDPVPAKGASSWTYFDLAAVATLVVFSAVRFGIGTDYDTYAIIYGRVDTEDWAREIATAPQELGFTLLLLIVKTVDPTPTTFFWVTSILTVVPAFVAIRQVSARPVLGVLLYVLFAFYLTPFNLVRQGIAVSLLFWATTCLRRRPVLFVVVAVVAASIHSSAVIALAVMWVSHRWRPTPWTVGLILAGAVAGLVGLDRFSALGDLVARLNPRYESYLSASGAGVGTYLQIVLFLALLVYAAVLGRHQDPGVTARTAWMTTFVLIGVAFMIVSTQAIPFGRLAPYFTIFLVLLLPERVAASRNPVAHDVALATGGAAFYAFHLAFYGGLIPYQTYFT